MKTWSASLVPLLVMQLALPACVGSDGRGRRRAEYDQKALAEGQRAKTVSTKSGPFLVESTIYHPALLPLEGFFKQLARGNFAKAAEQLDWRFVPTNVDASLIAELLDAGYLPALVKVTNTGPGPASMQSLLLSASLGNERGLAVPNAELPTKLDEVHWSNLGANAAGVAGNTAIVVGIIALAYVGAQTLGKSSGNGGNLLRLVPNAHVGPVQIGFGDGVLCPGGVPVSFDGKPFTNEQAAAMASACFKQAHAVPVPTMKMDRKLTRVVDLDYSQVLLGYRTLAAGESSVGLQFFKLPGGIADWQAGAVHAEVLPNGPVAGQPLANAGAWTKNVGFFRGDAGAKVELKPMTPFRCGLDDDSGRFTMTFLDTYGEDVLSEKLEIVFGGKDLPKPGSYTFDPSDSDQKVTLYLGTELGALNGAWRSFVAGGKQSGCRLDVASAERTVRSGRRLEGASLAFFDEFQVAGTLDCMRVADFDTGSTKQWMKFKADVACRGPWQAEAVKTARGEKHDRPVRARDL